MKPIDRNELEMIYAFVDSGKAQPDAFTTMAQAFAICQPSAASHAAEMYLLESRRLNEVSVSMDVSYVTGLFEIGLNVPRHLPVAKAVAVAIGMAALPESRLGKATPLDRYLILHGAALKSQEYVGEVGRQMIAHGNSLQPQAALARYAPWLVAGLLILFAWLFFR